jgi:hypothetical protein
MATNNPASITLPPNPTPAVLGMLMILTGVFGLYSDHLPLWAEICLILMGIFFVTQIKRVIVENDRITITHLLTGTQKQYAKSEIERITAGQIDAHSDIAAKPRMISIRLANKKTVAISTATISQDNFASLVHFLKQHYVEKLA